MFNLARLLIRCGVWGVFLGMTLIPSEVLASPTPLRIGFIGPLSGPVASYGIGARNGLELAIADAKKAEVIKVTYEDDQFTPVKTVAAFRALTQTQSIDVVICIGSPPCNAIAPLAEAKGIPLIGWASDRKVALGRKWVIRSFPSGEAEGGKTLAVARERGFKNIGVFTAIHDFALSWRAGIVTPKIPSEVLLDEQVPPDLKDFSSILAKAKRLGVQDFMLCLLPGQSGIFAKKAREIGISSKIGGCVFLEDPGDLNASAGALQDAWYITLPVTAQFRERYQSLHGKADSLSGAALHYDIGTLLAEAGDKRGAALMEDLKQKKERSGMGGAYEIVSSDGDAYFNYHLEAVGVDVMSKAPIS